MWVPSRARFVPDYKFDLESNRVPFLEHSHVEWKTGAEAKTEWGYSSRSPRESPFTSHGAHSRVDPRKGFYLLRLNVELAR